MLRTAQPVVRITCGATAVGKRSPDASELEPTRRDQGHARIALHPDAGFTGEAWASTAATKAVSLIHLNLRETLTLSARPSPAPAARTVVESPRAAPRSVDSIHVRKPLRPLSHGGGDCQEAVM